MSLLYAKSANSECCWLILSSVAKFGCKGKVLGLSEGMSRLITLFRDKEASLNIEVKKPEIGTLRKEGYWYGPNSYLKDRAGIEPKAEAICNNCSHQSFTYTWLVDMDDDGNFSGSSDRSYVQESYAPSFDEYGKTVRLMAEHDEAEAAIREYVPKVYKDIVSNKGASVAQMSDGSVIAWGDSAYGGVLDTATSSALSSSSTSVIKLVATHRAFAALMSDGSVVAWGDGSYGGRLDASKLTLIQAGGGAIDIAATQGAFAVVLSNGGVEAWGDGSSHHAPTTSRAIRILATDTTFFVMLSDSSAYRWDDHYWGSIPATEVEPNSHIPLGKYDSSNHYGFSVFVTTPLKGDYNAMIKGTIFVDENSDETRHSVTLIEKNVTSLFVTAHHFFAFYKDGSVTPSLLDNTRRFETLLTPSFTARDVRQVYSTFGSSGKGAFAVLKNNGAVITWGDGIFGGTPEVAVEDLIKEPNSVIDMYQNDNVFMALQPDGNLVVWGNIVSPNDVILATATESEKVIP